MFIVKVSLRSGLKGGAGYDSFDSNSMFPCSSTRICPRPVGSQAEPNLYRKALSRMIQMLYHRTGTPHSYPIPAENAVYSKQPFKTVFALDVLLKPS
ncbi:hypothetical protein NPIL_421861 [Nephila pilipes]|uniref:Uncharacterized protein n=1 Tax=Nephila pilipes TaxID=299642 RepID=A0A8X6J7Q6_NEPPI|nr:hypothetical protein NPIL_421861 [Nephila pilipes]